MTIEELASKALPPLVVAMTIALSGVVISVYIMKSNQEEIQRQNIKQWEYISDLTETSIRNDERINHLKGK